MKLKDNEGLKRSSNRSKEILDNLHLDIYAKGYQKAISDVEKVLDEEIKEEDDWFNKLDEDSKIAEEQEHYGRVTILHRLKKRLLGDKGEKK
jgi:hypothetical protein